MVAMTLGLLLVLVAVGVLFTSSQGFNAVDHGSAARDKERLATELLTSVMGCRLPSAARAMNKGFRLAPVALSVERLSSPSVPRLADPAAADIAVDSLGRRRCNGSTSALKPCWP